MKNKKIVVTGSKNKKVVVIGSAGKAQIFSKKETRFLDGFDEDGFLLFCDDELQFFDVKKCRKVDAKKPRVLNRTGAVKKPRKLNGTGICQDRAVGPYQLDGNWRRKNLC